MQKKIKVSFAVPENLRNDLIKYVINAGYGLRGKSRWVCEAINTLFDIENYIELVEYNDEMSSFERIETIVVDIDTRRKLDEAVLKVRMKYPMLEGVLSRIIRTAIVQRILRS